MFFSCEHVSRPKAPILPMKSFSNPILPSASHVDVRFRLNHQYHITPTRRSTPGRKKKRVWKKEKSTTAHQIPSEAGRVRRERFLQGFWRGPSSSTYSRHVVSPSNVYSGAHRPGTHLNCMQIWRWALTLVVVAAGWTH